MLNINIIYRGNVTNLRSRHWDKKGCRSKLCMKGNEYRKRGKKHNHLSEEKEVNEISLTNNCLRRAQLERTRPKRIFEEERERHFN